MKIWATEKLDRVLNVLFDFQDDRPALTATNPRQVTQTYHANPVQNDLSHLLRNERLHGPTDRDPSVASKDLHFWKGPFIYVHDMFGTNRPIIMREYPKVQRREDGTWPQFRSVSGGKCPFIEESVHQRREKDRAGRERAEPVKEKAKAPETKKESSQEEHPKPDVKEIVQAQKPVTKEASEMGPRPATSKEKEPVEEHAKPITKAKETAEARPKAVESVASKERSPPKSRAYAGKGRRVLNEVNETDHRTNSRAIARPALEAASTKRGARPENTIAFTATNESTAQTARRCNVEPAASGLQPSNVTSAIRSAMISSHQDQPGQRAGTSKEIHALHRKVAGNVLMGNIPKAASLTRRATDSVAAKVPEAEVPKLLRRRTADGQSEEQKVREAQVLRKHPKPEPKPGYCENCREKFEDFEEVGFRFVIARTETNGNCSILCPDSTANLR